jgi:LysM repeat protein
MHCKRCGARLQQGMLICPECGARQGRQPGSVRCASCHGRVPTGLTVCPHCGRAVRAAGPRWGLWALLAAGLVLVGLYGLGRLPVGRVRQQVLDTRDRLSGLVQVLDLPTSVPATPTRVRIAAVPPTATPSALPIIAVSEALTVTVTGPEEIGETTETAPISPTLTLTATAVAEPTAAATMTATAAPSATLAPTATPTQTPTARAAATATPTVIPTATTAGAGVTYVVKAGDTLAGIGAQFGVPWEDILSANNIASATSLQIGQKLRIPVAGAPLPPTATPRPKPTATPVPIPPTTAPLLDAPVLENPADGSQAYGDTAEIELRWQPVPGIPADGQYQVTIQYVEGGERRTDVLPPTSSTAQRFPLWLFGRADLPGRRYTWYVTVVRMGTDGKGGEVAIPLSRPSSPHLFEWQ